MSVIKSGEEVEIIREAGRRLAAVISRLKKEVRPGISTVELDELAEKLIREKGDSPAFLNYTPDGSIKPFPATLCVSVENEVVHGIPGKRILKEGEIVGLDLGLRHRNLFVDMAVTVPVGEVSKEKELLIDSTKEALEKAISLVSVGRRVGELGEVIEKIANNKGYGIIRDLGGHGLGYVAHDKPYIPNFGDKNEGPKLRKNEVIAIEPMFNLGGDDVFLGKDDYTVMTRDNSTSAHFEHTVLVTENGGEVITKLN